MDDPALPPAELAAVLRDLGAVNAVTLAAGPTLRFLARTLRGHRRLRLLDVGAGGGDTLRRVARWAAKRGIEAELVGIDLNPAAAPAARAATDPALPIDYRTGDYRALADEPWDVIASSLVAHHMTDAQLAAFLRFMEARARIGWIVNDLHRTRFAHEGFPLLARIMRWHPIVAHDGQLSVARSFRPGEWRAILRDAGLGDVPVTVARRFPFRLCVERVR